MQTLPKLEFSDRIRADPVFQFLNKQKALSDHEGDKIRAHVFSFLQEAMENVFEKNMQVILS